MGLISWDLDGGFISLLPKPIRNPRLTIRCEYPDEGMAPSEVTFGLSRRYGIHTAREVHDWFLEMMREHEEFEVETDKPGELPIPFFSVTVTRVVVEAPQAA